MCDSPKSEYCKRPQSLQNLNSTSRNGSGTRIGPYLVGKTLGVGSTGRVKLGTHIESGFRVAIKIIAKASLLEKYSNDPVKQLNMNQKLEREITLMKLIQHPNIMQLYDVYETDRDLFLILEYIEGGELFDYLVKRGRLSEPEALGFFQQIIFGVDYCHRNLICHRDLKPENLLLDKNLNIKIADFGMASLQVPTKMLETSCGSPHYASPEIIKGIKYDGPPADVWSCGIILYALLTGNLPFDDENIRRLLSKVKTGIYYVPEYLSAGAKDLINRMIVVDPDRRIKMSEIMRHPWFSSITPKIPYIPSALETSGNAVFEPNMLDEEILKNLQIIGWGNEEYLKKQLTSKERNFEKVFYVLLLQRKTNFFENYDVNKLNEWDIEGGPRRRTESYNSLYVDRASSREMYRSNDTINSPTLTRGVSVSNNTLYSPTNSSTPILYKSNDLNSHTPPNECSGKQNNNENNQSKQLSREELLKRQVKNAVHINSPLATNLINTDIEKSPTDTTNNNNPIGKEPVNDHTSVSNVNSPSSNNNNSTGSPNPVSQSPVIIKNSNNNEIVIQHGVRPRPLQINIPSKNMVDESTRKSNKALNIQVSTPRFHRRKIDFPIPPSPIITSTPKKSWFANLFNFKPEAVSLLSMTNVEKTTAVIQDIMENLSIKYQVKRDNGFKCKWDGGDIPTSILQEAREQMMNDDGSGNMTNNATTTNSSSMNGKMNSGVDMPDQSVVGSGDGSNSINAGSSQSPSQVQPNDTIASETSSNLNTTITISSEEGNVTSAASQTGDKSPTKSVDSAKHNSATAMTNSATTEVPLSSSGRKSETVAMKSVKFKIDILPTTQPIQEECICSTSSSESEKVTSTTKVIFTQQQGSYSSFQVAVYNIKTTWERIVKEGLDDEEKSFSS